MRIAKPLLLVTTPLGVLGGLYEAYRLAGGLVILMAAMVGLIGAAFGTVIATIRREQAELANASAPGATRGDTANKASGQNP
jgi:hypothetical protein